MSLTLMPVGAVIRHVHCRLLGYKLVKLGFDKEPGTEPSILMSLLSAVQLGSEQKQWQIVLFVTVINRSALVLFVLVSDTVYFRRSVVLF